MVKNDISPSSSNWSSVRHTTSRCAAHVYAMSTAGSSGTALAVMCVTARSHASLFPSWCSSVAGGGCTLGSASQPWCMRKRHASNEATCASTSLCQKLTWPLLVQTTNACSPCASSARRLGWSIRTDGPAAGARAYAASCAPSGASMFHARGAPSQHTLATSPWRVCALGGASPSSTGSDCRSVHAASGAFGKRVHMQNTPWSPLHCCALGVVAENGVMTGDPPCASVSSVIGAASAVLGAGPFCTPRRTGKYARSVDPHGLNETYEAAPSVGLACAGAYSFASGVRALARRTHTHAPCVSTSPCAIRL